MAIKEVSQLQRQIDYTYPLINERSFFLGLADYIEIVEKSDLLSNIVNKYILFEREKENTELNKTAEKVIKEIETTYKKIRSKIKEKKVDETALQYIYTKYDDLLSGRTKSSQPLAVGLYTDLSLLIGTLPDIKGGEFAKRYAIRDRRNKEIITGWRISPTYEFYSEQIARFKRNHNVKVWGAFTELWWVYATCFKDDVRFDLKIDVKDFLTRMNYFGIQKRNG